MESTTPNSTSNYGSVEGNINNNQNNSRHLFITVGKGLEEVAQSEIMEKAAKFKPKIRDVVTGKVFFETNTSEITDLLNTLATLKTVERVFAVVGLVKTPKFDHRAFHASTYQKTVDFEKNLKEQICNLSGWNSAQEIWKFGVDAISDLEHSEERPNKKQKTDETIGVEEKDSSVTKSNIEVRFRISCKSSKSLQHVKPQSVGKFLGIAIRNKFGWQVDLDQYNMEIYVHVSNPDTIVGIPLLQGKNLAERDYIKRTGMRSSLAYAMCKLADIKPFQIVCDPMCGNGIVLIEASKNFPSLHLIGCDIEQAKIRICFENLEYAKITNADIIQCDIKNLLVRTASVDRIVSDIPFGQQYGSYETMKVLYPIILSHMARILKPSQTAVILTSQTLLLEWNLKRMSELWANDWTKSYVKLGYTQAYIYVLHRSPKEFQNPVQ